MHDPFILKYDKTDYELQEFLLFCIAAGNTNAKAAASAVDRLVGPSAPRLPFDTVKSLGSDLQKAMQIAGLRMNVTRSRYFLAVAESGLDLRTCTVRDLEKVLGIGPKTSRFFIVHSRPGQRYAVLDVHIMTYLRGKGFETPKRPTKTNYARWEKVFLAHADEIGIIDLAEFDIGLWAWYREARDPASAN